MVCCRKSRKEIFGKKGYVQQRLHLAEEMLSGTGIHIHPNMYLAEQEKRRIYILHQMPEAFFQLQYRTC
jgi:hypothetical protein